MEDLASKMMEVLTEKRFKHTLGVAETAVSLAKRYGADEDKAYVAAMLHDCAKNLADGELKKLCRKYNVVLDHVSKRETALLHAYVGANLARDEYGVTDEEILDAIYYHTTGKKDMSLLCKIVFLADMIEPGRQDYPGLAKIRELSEKDLDGALIEALNSSICFNINKGVLLHLDTLKARNFLLEERKERLNGN